MTARVLDGRAIAAEVRAEVARDAAALRAEKGVPPGLAVVLVGENPASQSYVGMKDKAAKEAGFYSFTRHVPASTSEREILELVEFYNADPLIHGILVQLPLPSHVSESRVLAAVAPGKDVDGFHPVNQGLLLQGTPRFVPATPRGVQELLLRSKIDVAGKHVVILGRSNIVGKPLAALLMAKGAGADATVTVCHSRTPNVAELARQADVLVAAMGKPRFVTRDMVKPGATVIDVGTTKVDGKLVGDVDFEAVKEVSGAITPVPGGVGPMTIALLLRNTVDAARGILGR